EQPTDAINSLVDDEHVDSPKEEETNKLRQSDAKCGGGARSEAGNKDRHDFVNGIAANPGLNAKPTAGDERAHERGNVRAARSKRSATENREGDSVTRPGVCIEDHRNNDDQIAKENGEDGLRPIHPTANKR